MRRELNETSRQPATTTDRGGTVHRAHRRRLHLRHDAVPGQSRAGSIHRRHQRDHRGRAGRSHHPRTGPDVGGCRLRRHQCAHQEAVPRSTRQPSGSRGHLPDDHRPLQEGQGRHHTADQHGRAWYAKTAAWLHAHHQRLTAWRRDELLIPPPGEVPALAAQVLDPPRRQKGSAQGPILANILTWLLSQELFNKPAFRLVYFFGAFPRAYISP